MYVRAETGAASSNAVARTIAGRIRRFMGYTDTSAVTAEETGTCWVVVANTVIV